MNNETTPDVTADAGYAWPARRTRLGEGFYLLAYVAVLAIPYGLAFTVSAEHRPLFQALVTLLNLCGLAALLLQFPLAARSRSLAQTMGIDQAMVIHRKAGELIAIFFFLHPFLIVLPRLLVAPQLAFADVWTAFTAGNVRTGLYAWMFLLVWALVAWSRRKAGLSYEAWRLSHSLGFAAVAILATLHVITVGRHGQAQAWFNGVWIAGCTLAVALVANGLFVRPGLWRRRPFKVVQVTRAGASDWELEIEKDSDFPFAFDAGQFVWLTTSRLPWLRVEHPFSIASSPMAGARLKFVIRQLGDYTASLGRLRPGQRVLVDGPFGIFTLAGRRGRGLAFIAGGCGIGPVLGIIRSLRDQAEGRPIRLLYGNRSADQLVCQDELREIERQLPDFRQVIALENADPVATHTGLIDEQALAMVLPEGAAKNWLVFVCGPPVMARRTVRTLRRMGFPRRAIVYEQFSF